MTRSTALTALAALAALTSACSGGAGESANMAAANETQPHDMNGMAAADSNDHDAPAENEMGLPGGEARTEAPAAKSQPTPAAPKSAPAVPPAKAPAEPSEPKAPPVADPHAGHDMNHM